MTKKKDILTKQDKKFIEIFTETGNRTLSAQKAYGIKDESYAGKKGSLKVREGKIQDVIKTIADSIPDELLIEKHLALLNKKEVIARNNIKTGEIDVVPTGEIDSNAVSRGLDMGYKLKGSYAPEKKSIEIDEDLLEAVKGRVGNILE